MSKKAIVLFNLGGPKNLREIKPFLFNLFYDRAIINLMNPFRYLLAKFISAKREDKAQGIYSKIGGGSPILEQTEKQAAKIEAKINKLSKDSEYKVLVAMRYSKPGSKEAVEQILKKGYGEIILLPLYPHFSTTTTQSSIDEFLGLVPKFYTGKIKAVCCYYKENSFVVAHKRLIAEALEKVNNKNIRILFSAHSLPEKIIKGGDPYQWQIEQTCMSIMQDRRFNSLEYAVCYQSKVGSLKWLEPSTESEIVRAAKQKLPVLVVPISFVSEHSETLVELDIDYKDLAQKHGLAEFYRVPTLQVKDEFIDGLAELIEKVSCSESNKQFSVYPANNKERCPAEFCKCLFRKSSC